MRPDHNEFIRRQLGREPYFPPVTEREERLVYAVSVSNGAAEIEAFKAVFTPKQVVVDASTLSYWQMEDGHRHSRLRFAPTPEQAIERWREYTQKSLDKAQREVDKLEALLAQEVSLLDAVLGLDAPLTDAQRKLVEDFGG